VSIDTDPRVRPLLGGRNRLLQACLHIVMNAYDAMSDTGGRLDVRSVQGENEVVLRFEDSGRGMAPEVVARIFDPFFTTKPAGSGTGLGLFVCQRIVAEEFRGRIDVETGPGRGACFIVTLPVRARTVPDGSSQSPADAS
jgi:signal transduction histidine kinase